MNRLADVSALAARISVGTVFMLHGWHKLSGGFANSAEAFAGIGVPLPQAAVALSILIEFGGGLALLLGLALPVSGVALAAQMAAAYAFAHVGDPLVSANGGSSFQLVLLLGIAALALGFNGGRYTLDRLLPWGRSRAPETAQRA